MRRPYLFAAFSLAVAALLFAFAVRAEAGTVCNIFPAARELPPCLHTAKSSSEERVASMSLSHHRRLAEAAVVQASRPLRPPIGSPSSLRAISRKARTSILQIARAISALTGQSNSIFTNGAGYLTSLAEQRARPSIRQQHIFRHRRFHQRVIQFRRHLAELFPVPFPNCARIYTL